MKLPSYKELTEFLSSDQCNAYCMDDDLDVSMLANKLRWFLKEFYKEELKNENSK